MRAGPGLLHPQSSREAGLRGAGSPYGKDTNGPSKGSSIGEAVLWDVKSDRPFRYFRYP
jgi:hypothetical protein